MTNPTASSPTADMAAAYQHALADRAEKISNGAQPRGFKVGFTNRNIWPRYNVFAPIWGSMWQHTVTYCEGSGSVSLAGFGEPRLEPEAVFGIRSTPPVDPSMEALFDCIEWLAPGFELVQTPVPGWKFTPPQTVAAGAMHAHLLVGKRVPVREIAGSAAALEQKLAAAQLALLCGDEVKERGVGANVLDNPLRALAHFLAEMRACPGAPDLVAGDVVTTGTWTDAWPVAPGQRWRAVFDAPLSPLEISLA